MLIWRVYKGLETVISVFYILYLYKFPLDFLWCFRLQFQFTLQIFPWQEIAGTPRDIKSTANIQTYLFYCIYHRNQGKQVASFYRCIMVHLDKCLMMLMIASLPPWQHTPCPSNHRRHQGNNSLRDLLHSIQLKKRVPWMIIEKYVSTK